MGRKIEVGYNFEDYSKEEQPYHIRANMPNRAAIEKGSRKRAGMKRYWVEKHYKTDEKKTE